MPGAAKPIKIIVAINGRQTCTCVHPTPPPPNIIVLPNQSSWRVLFIFFIEKVPDAFPLPVA